MKQNDERQFKNSCDLRLGNFFYGVTCEFFSFYFSFLLSYLLPLKFDEWKKKKCKWGNNSRDIRPKTFKMYSPQQCRSANQMSQSIPPHIYNLT